MEAFRVLRKREEPLDAFAGNIHLMSGRKISREEEEYRIVARLDVLIAS
jgi:hypothetical protein